MPTTFEYLEGESKDNLYNCCDCEYLDRNCYEFAVALHRGLGWTMVGLINDSKPNEWIRHVALLQPDGKLRDVRGEISLEEFGTHLDDVNPPYVTCPVTEDDLLGIRPVAEAKISLARRLAEALYPELPWYSGQQKQYKEFADELEKLSRRTGVWIRSSIPACPPALAQGYGDEKGYVLKQTIDGFGFTIDRVL